MEQFSENSGTDSPYVMKAVFPWTTTPTSLLNVPWLDLSVFCHLSLQDSISHLF